MKLNPLVFGPLVRMVFWQLGRKLQVVLLLSGLLVACGQPDEELLAQARTLLGQKKYAEVVALLEPRKLDLAGADLWNMLGVAYLETTKPAEALASFNAAIKQDNQNYKYYYNRGNAYLALKQPDEALKDYDQALALDQSVYDLYLNRAAVLASMNRHQEALPDYDRAEKLNQSDRSLFFNRGQTYFAIKEFAKAAGDFRQAVALSPDYARAHLALGLAELQLGNGTTAACAHLQRAQELGSAEAAAALAQHCGR